MLKISGSSEKKRKSAHPVSAMCVTSGLHGQLSQVRREKNREGEGEKRNESKKEGKEEREREEERRREEGRGDMDSHLDFTDTLELFQWEVSPCA